MTGGISRKVTGSSEPTNTRSWLEGRGDEKCAQNLKARPKSPKSFWALRSSRRLPLNLSVRRTYRAEGRSLAHSRHPPRGHLSTRRRSAGRGESARRRWVGM